MNFDAQQRAALIRQLRSGGKIECPACTETMEAETVEPKGPVAYVRRRLWIVCRGCKRSMVVDRRGLE